MFQRFLAHRVQAPCLHRRACGLAVTGVALEHVRQAFFFQHQQRLVQRVEQVRRWRVGIKARLVGLQHLFPVPVGSRHRRALACVERFLRNRREPQAGRQHQAFLRTGDRDVHFPLVVPEVDRPKRGNRVDDEQGGMAGAIHRAADLDDAAGDARRRFVVHDDNRLEFVIRVGRQPRFDLGR